MADNEVFIRVKADASDARKELETVEKSAQRVKKTVESTGAADSVSFGSRSPLPGRPGSGQSPAAPSVTNDGIGRAVGKELGKWFMTDLAQKGIDFAVQSLRNPLNPSAGLQIAGDSAKSAIDGAVALGSIGAEVAGLKGALIGGAAGAIGGGISGWFLADKQTKNASLLAKYQAGELSAQYAQRSADAASDEAFGLMLGRATRSKRLKMIAARRAMILSGDGDESIENINSAMSLLRRQRRSESSDYQELAGRRSEQLARIAQLDAVTRQLERKPLAPIVQGSQYADALSSRGINVGASVDIAGINRSTLTEMQHQTALLEQLANKATTPASNADLKAYGF